MAKYDANLAQQKRDEANDEGAAPKKIKFRYYQPLPLHRPAAAEPHLHSVVNLSTHDAAQAAPVNLQYAEFDYSARVRAGLSSDSESSTSDISTVTPPLSSARTTPDLNLIDPRLLRPGISGENDITSANMVNDTSVQQPSPSSDDEDTGQDDRTVAQSCERMSSLRTSSNARNYQDARVIEPTASPGSAEVQTGLSGVDSSSLEDKALRDDSSAGRRVRPPSPSTLPVMTPRYFSKSRNTGYISRDNALLTLRERSSVATLRQVWRDIEYSSVQRHTRS
ncbi:hypothetical protein BJX96DRAFT_184893 [Aspergillus floccosus]